MLEQVSEHKRKRPSDLPKPEQTGDSCTGSLNMPEYFCANQCQKNRNVRFFFFFLNACSKKCSMYAT